MNKIILRQMNLPSLFYINDSNYLSFYIYENERKIIWYVDNISGDYKVLYE